jgi:hypothetical protein
MVKSYAAPMSQNYFLYSSIPSSMRKARTSSTSQVGQIVMTTQTKEQRFGEA